MALRIFAFSTRFSRKHYGYYVIDGSHTVCRRLWYYKRPRKSAVWAIIQNRSGCSIKRHLNGRRKAAVVLRKVVRFACGQYGSFTVFAVSLRFIAFRRIRAAKFNVFNFLRARPERAEGHGNPRFIWRYICGFLRLYNRREPRLEPHKCERGITQSINQSIDRSIN